VQQGDAEAGRQVNEVNKVNEVIKDSWETSQHTAGDVLNAAAHNSDDDPGPEWGNCPPLYPHTKRPTPH
jgi:hypothetical protein